MKFGIHSGLWMARWTDDIAPVFTTVADLGFDGVEVSLLGMTDEKAATLRGLADDHGLEVTCSDGLSREADISSPDPEVRAPRGWDYLRWAVRTTAAMGSRGARRGHLRAVGCLRSGQQGGAGRALGGGVRGPRCRPRIATTSPSASRRSTASRPTSSTPRKTRWHWRQPPASPRVGVLLDTFHMNIEEKDVAAAIVSARDHLVHFHVSDNDRGGSRLRPRPLGRGPARPRRHRLRPVDRGGDVRGRRQPGQRRPEHLARHRARCGPRGGADAAVHAGSVRVSDAFFSALAERFRELEQPLNALDAATGDGDHGAAMRRGLEAVTTAEPGTAAQAFRGRGGRGFGHAVRSARRRTRSRPCRRQGTVVGTGRTRPDRSRSSAWRSEATRRCWMRSFRPPRRPVQCRTTTRRRWAAEAARRGAEATTRMAARRGRARYVENGGIGHGDAGARSVAEMLSEYARFSKARR